MASDLERFTQDLLAAANDLKGGKYTNEFLRKEGNKLKKGTVAEAKSKIKKRTGRLFKSIKRGKTYKYDGNLAVRVYGTGHVHLINNGHRIVDINGVEHGFKEGEHFFESAESKFKDDYFNDTEKFVDELLDSHGL